MSRTLAELVRDVAGRTPGAPAIEQTGVVLSYAELIHEADRLAADLTRAGAGAEDVVALDLAPTPRTVAAMLAAGSVGAAFLPLDPREPLARREAMFAAARPAAVVTPDAVVARPGGEPLSNRLAPRRGPAAYVSFTSGSTGTPKAVVTEQPAVVNYVRSAAAAYDLTPQDRQLQFSSIAFDIAIDEVFTTLSRGATLVLRDSRFIFDGLREFLACCERLDLTVLNLPTGLWNLFGAELAADPGIRLPERLRLVVVGGEAAVPAAVGGWQAAAVHPGFALINAYGPTEAAVSVTFANLRAGRPVTIGRALPGVELDLLDAELAPVAEGETGEIVIGGVATARGYLDSTSGGFTELEGRWVYRTGDLGRRTPDGDLEFLGRADEQIKVRGGFRVEPGEVAHALLQHPAVLQAHVQPHERSGTRVLAAFVVLDLAGPAEADAPAALREHLAGRLPHWMQPTVVQVVTAVPLTARGKVDAAALAALLAPEVAGPADVAEAVARAWEDALGIEPDGDDENFFEAGGDSMAAMAFLAGLSALLGRSLPVAQLYREPTPRQIAEALRASDSDDPGIPTAHHTTGRTLVRLRRGGAGRLWCFLPPLSGAVTRYASMARALPEGDAVWAMETPAVLSDGGMDRLADGLAEHVVAAGLDDFDTVVFSGYSLGGVFAHEVARRVESALVRPGRGPGPTIAAMLLDPPDPAEPQMKLSDAFDIFVRVGWRIGEPVDSFVDGEERFDLAAVAEAARRAGSLPADAADSEVADAWLVYASNTRILDDYRLSPGVARTRLLQCREGAAPTDGTWVDGSPSGSWTVVPARDTSLVGVEHFALMEPPNDRTVVDWLVSGADRLSSADREPVTAGRRA